MNELYEKLKKQIAYWQKNSYFCSEVVGKMTGIDCQMTAPVTLMSKLKNEIQPQS